MFRFSHSILRKATPRKIQRMEMKDKGIKISDGKAEALLPANKPIGITPTAKTERDKGASVIRFMLEGDVVKEREPFDQLATWYFEGTELTLQAVASGKVDGCTLRECNLDLSSSRLYVSIYTTFPAQQVRHWFEE